MTDLGREVIEDSVRIGIEVQEEALSVLTPQERSQLGALLRKLHAGFEDRPFE